MTIGTRLFPSAAPAATPQYVGAGIILFRLDPREEAPRFLLLQGRDTGIWSFSKGHPEPEDGGEPFRTAIRETREETGYEVGRDYTLLSNTHVRLGKRPYWIGLMTPGASMRPRLAPGEHITFGWFTWSEAGELTSNTDVRAWHKKAVIGNSGFTRLLASVGLVLSLGSSELPGRLSETSSRRSRHSFAPACSES